MNFQNSDDATKALKEGKTDPEVLQLLQEMPGK